MARILSPPSARSIRPVRAGDRIRAERVTVYRTGARVTRTAGARLEIGTSRLIFTDLPEGVDSESVRFRGTGDFTVLSVSTRTEFHGPETPSKDPPEIAAIRERLDELRVALTIDRARIDSIGTEERYVSSITESGSQEPRTVADMVAAADFLRDRLPDIKQRRINIDERVKELTSEQRDLQEQLREYAATFERKRSTDVIVTVDARRVSQATFEIDYQLDAAQWNTRYDLRVPDLSTPMELTHFADIEQRSGEDWSNVDVTLSTGYPTSAAHLPELVPWRISPPTPRPIAYGARPRRSQSTSSSYSYGQLSEQVRNVSGTIRDTGTGRPLPGATIVLPPFNVGTTTDINGRYGLRLPQGATLLQVSMVGFESINIPIRSPAIDIFLAAGQEMYDVTVTADKDMLFTAPEDDKNVPAATIRAEQEVYPTVTEYAISEQLTIPSDGKTRTVELRRLSIPAGFEHVVVPKRNPVAFLTATVPDWSKYDLRSSSASIFMGKVYVGETVLATSSTADTLVVPLGPDPGITVRREKKREFSKVRFLGSKRHVSLGFSITMRNSKPDPVTIVVRDQVPISTDKSIEVDLGEVGGATFDAETGFLKWTLDLEPGATETVGFDYTVKYPKNMRLPLE